MVAIFGDHCVDHHPVADQALFDDPRRSGGRRHSAFLAMLASALFALGHHHEVLGGLHIQLLADVVSNHRCRLAASRTGALLRCAGHHALHTRQLGGQLLSTWMRTGLAVRGCRQRLTKTFRLDFDTAHSRLESQQVELCIAELLAARTILLDQG
jgi:hypothetical protein